MESVVPCVFLKATGSAGALTAGLDDRIDAVSCGGKPDDERFSLAEGRKGRTGAFAPQASAISFSRSKISCLYFLSS
ncbi:hypothetical protein [Desulfosarcina variabilis]|uniref:hypothetical protein n=1 Tax=Desulfosarcina variabilis TaxID=2300 RepID=UPI003AFAE1DB